MKTGGKQAFFFSLFSETFKPPAINGGVLKVDGKNDSLFLKRLHDEFFLKTKQEGDFLRTAGEALKESGSALGAWLRQREDMLGDNFEFVIWSAWTAAKHHQANSPDTN